jgi:hypothetical protein
MPTLTGRCNKEIWTKGAACAVAGLLLLAMPVSAQWKNLPMDGVPLGPDGKPNMSAPAPKTSDDKADLSGIYMPNMKYFRNLAADLGLENVPMTDEARKIHKLREDGTRGWESSSPSPIRPTTRSRGR